MTEGPSTNHTNKPQYVLRDKGAPSCSSGSAITEKSLCMEACSELGIISSLKDGNQCYRTGNGRCRQDGREGKGAYLVCTNKDSTGTWNNSIFALLENVNVVSGTFGFIIWLNHHFRD